MFFSKLSYQPVSYFDTEGGDAMCEQEVIFSLKRGRVKKITVSNVTGGWREMAGLLKATIHTASSYLRKIEQGEIHRSLPTGPVQLECKGH